ncbi:MAG: 4-alpha-glucanotransferase, partial [Clostridia bacterium]|nr:4-alpha-glucanotransferase [Clostridia bacterium]
AVKEDQQNVAWWEWDAELAAYESCLKVADRFEARTMFWLFVQSMFWEQWSEIHAYAAEKGVKILGDMPIYVSMDSVDVWSHRDMFCIDQRTFRPDKVAGVPPDYFSADGQLWGNPLYDWDAMKKSSYAWWIDRVKMALDLYDMVRIDHFRAFASYWAVPATAKTAKEGEWEKGPGQQLFDAVCAAFDEPPAIVAEDLGTFGEDVIALLESSGFPGMRVIQFGFDPNGDSTHLPHNYPKNTVAYVGTHDNNTLLGWLWEARDDERRFALDYCGFDGNDWGEGGYQSRSCRRIIETVWKSSADLAIIAFQDMCGFGSDARMNIPGVPEKNWRFRTTADTIRAMDHAYFARINRLFRRG